jgi:hypothetical protein
MRTGRIIGADLLAAALDVEIHVYAPGHLRELKSTSSL